MKQSNKTILLALLPFWTPLIPPVGISSLKHFLQQQGYTVTAVDANVVPGFKKINDHYFQLLRQFIPSEKRKNLPNVGHEVMRDHMLAHMHTTDKESTDYTALVIDLVDKTFFHTIDAAGVTQLDNVVADFFTQLETYVLNLLEKVKPDVLGISTYSASLPASLFFFRLTREKFPHIRTLIGGGLFSGELYLDSPNFNLLLEQTPYIDKFIVGEGERLLLHYLQGRLPAEKRVYTVKDIDNQIMDLDTSGPPDFSDLELSYYPFLASHGSRGCPFQCTFCCENMFWGKYRKKTAARVVDELIELYKRHGSQLFLLCDSLLNPFIKQAAQEIIDKDVSIYWDGYLRVDKHVCDDANTFLWRKGGFYRARLGVESGSQKVLDLMHKGITVQQIKEALKNLAAAGIKTTTYWIVGYPGETEADFQQTLSLLEECRDNIYEAACNPFYYTLTGQSYSDQWAGEIKSIPLFPDHFKEKLIMQRWNLDTEPRRDEIYRRTNRFDEHCKQLGIPTLSTINDIIAADERWKKLQPNAAPSLVQFMESRLNPDATVDEHKHIQKTVLGQNIHPDSGDDGWDF